MKPDQTPDFTAAQMMALRDQTEALKTITAKLRVKEMGPADHIRTKHEVKAFIEATGDLNEAEAIVTRARARLQIWQTQNVTQKLSERQQRGQQMDD